MVGIMNKKQEIVNGVIMFSMIVLTSCNKDSNNKDCLSYEPAFVGIVEGPSTGQVNEEINFQVIFGVHNGCGQFGSFEESSEGNSRTISVTAKYEGCGCTNDAPGRIGTYKFKTSQAGTYYLKFLQVNNVYLIDTLTIQ
jgi:hypothetical protein